MKKLQNDVDLIHNIIMFELLNAFAVFHPPVVLPTYFSYLEQCMLFFDPSTEPDDASAAVHPSVEEAVEIAFSAPHVSLVLFSLDHNHLH
jgi:hypothetical protein